MAKKEQIKKNNELVVKDNDLILIGNRFDNMNITQMKIMNLIIAKFDNRLKYEDIKESDLIFNIPYSELVEKLQEKEIAKGKKLYDLCDNLSIKRWIEYQINLKTKKEEPIFYTIFSVCSYTNSILTIGLNIVLVKHFLKLGGNFTKYYFDNIARFKSKYSILLYELLKANKFKKEATYSIEELFVLLKVEKENMKKYGNFNLFILKKIQVEINETSDLHFEYSENKIPGTKIVESITFRIYDSEKNVNEYRDLRSFIAYIRKNYVNQLILKVKNSTIQLDLTVNQKGYLYFLNDTKRIDKEQSDKYWQILFDNQNKIEKYTKSLFEQ